MSVQYLVYRRPDLDAMLLSKMRCVAEAYGIEHSGLTRAQLRRAILLHPSNQSLVPHPLIVLPV